MRNGVQGDQSVVDRSASDPRGREHCRQVRCGGGVEGCGLGLQVGGVR